MLFQINVTLIYLIAIFFVCLASNDLGFDGNLFSEDIISDGDLPNDFGQFPEDVETEGNHQLSPPITNVLSPPIVRAVAVLKGFSTTLGLIHLIQIGGGPTKITGKIIGLRPLGLHGFHFHERPVLGGCESAGEHYNPTRQHHGGPNSPLAHVGDLGNVHANIKGISFVKIIDQKVSLTGRHSVIGRSLVVHTNTDDLGTGPNRESRKSGNSGGRLACGTIKFVNIKKR